MNRRSDGPVPQTVPGNGPAGRLALGLNAVDQALGGGLGRGALHAVMPADPRHLGAASGFVLGLAVRALDLTPAGLALWVAEAAATRQGGPLHAEGVAGFGLALDRLVLVPARDTLEALWTAEEALRCPAVAVVVIELAGAGADLTMTRRLSLAAGAGGGLGLMLHAGDRAMPGAFHSRWRVGARPGQGDALGGLGVTAWDLALTRNRHGPEGCWPVEWHHDRRAFTLADPAAATPAVPRPVAAVPRHRPSGDCAAALG